MPAVGHRPDPVLVGARTPTPRRAVVRARFPVPVDLSELRKGGGGPKCCSSEVCP